MVNFNILSKFNGIAAVGDIHGNLQDMKQAIAYCKAHGYFFLSLGDLTDYGYDNHECVKLMHGIIQRGEGAMIIGNHDDKLKRYLVQRREGLIRVQVKGGLAVTVEELDRLAPDEYADFEKKFLEIYAGAKYHYVLANVMFVHAATYPEMWTQQDLGGKHKSRALFGQIDRHAPPRQDGFPNRIYDWVQDLDMYDDYNPQIAVVGHDVRSLISPLVNGSVKGGIAIFVDTGSSKGGKLSLVPFEITSKSQSPAGQVLLPLDFKTF